MKKLQNKKTKISEIKKQYTIKVTQKSNGFQARITLKIVDNGRNPRLTSHSAISIKDAVYKLLKRVVKELNEYKKMNLLRPDMYLTIYNSMTDSIQGLQLMSDTQIREILCIIFQVLVSPINETNTNNMTFLNNNAMNVATNSTDNIFQNTTSFLTEKEKTNYARQNQISKIESKDFKSVAIEWFEYKKSLTKESIENPKPLSQKTVQGYCRPLQNIIIPFFAKNNNISLITEKNLKECINSVDGYRTKEIVYIILKMLFSYAKDKGYIYYIPKLQKPKKPYTDKEEDIICIESDRHNLWIECLEKENTDVSLLFETMLLTGVRPEEACGLKWNAIDERTNELIIQNAYKDVPIYDGVKIIGHKREDSRLKTPESYRRIPLTKTLMQKLFEHKKEQEKHLNKHRIKQKEDEYIFLNIHNKPFVPESLAKPMRQFIKKYDLEYMTPYGLRHSFATFCSEQGMEEIVLMKLMGHTNFETTQKYYLCVSSKRKKNAIKEAYENVSD